MTINEMLGRYGIVYRKVRTLAMNTAFVPFKALHVPQVLHKVSELYSLYSGWKMERLILDLLFIKLPK